ncbi:hypothetical protein [Bacillus sp. ISL-7]|uniref:hypothetical protein n=1 Tax=Bacillus sp. ISL-7 TaxID=2819136 RepID=UPI001BEBB983|nr:hypothetical protein [Bacillus sp. ISL-7]MBT2733639.1 hypothetical protein [Bacillus sp. ISL-7]
MIKITKGALAMVLAGSVTFSVANALFSHPIKQLTKEMAIPISADRKKADVINPKEKKDKPQTPAANVKDRPVIQVSLKNRNTNDMEVAAIQQNIEKSSSRTTTSSANTKVKTTTKPAATPIPVKSTKAPTTTSKSTTTRPAASATTRPAASATTRPAASATTKPATSTKAPTTMSKPATTTPTKTTTTTATTTKTNRGQQVSQAAKERAASQSNKKENNGKKM